MEVNDVYIVMDFYANNNLRHAVRPLLRSTHPMS
jgi:hypothetical protein